MKLKLLKKITEAKGIETFYFTPERKINYYPGQNFYITLNELMKKDSRGPTRQFTLSSSPTENKLKITTDIRDQSMFKQTLTNLQKGDIISGEGPNGTFILDENERGEHVLIAGGIGITPFRSFIKYNVDKKLFNIKLHLVYSCKYQEKIIFADELSKWTNEYNNIKTAITLTELENIDSSWKGLTGRIDEKMINNLLSGWNLNHLNPIFWLCGPPAMVTYIEILLRKMKVSSSNIRSEKFIGY